MFRMFCMFREGIASLVPQWPTRTQKNGGLVRLNRFQTRTQADSLPNEMSLRTGQSLYSTHGPRSLP